MCYDKEKQVYSECTRSDVCKLSPYPKEEVWLIDTESIYTVKNWITNLNMYCASSFEIGFFGSCFFVGMMVASLVFPPLADIYGKKIIV